MATYSSPVLLVTAGVSNAPAGGLQWEGGDGVLIISALSGTPNFEVTIDAGASWVPVANSGSGALLTAIAAGGAYPFILPASRVRMSAGGGAMNCLIARA